MKDQKKLLAKCLSEDIPAIVFCGDDCCMTEILQAAEKIYMDKGCSNEFLKDFHQAVENARIYQSEYPDRIKLPGLTAEDILIIKEMEDLKKKKKHNTA